MSILNKSVKWLEKTKGSGLFSMTVEIANLRSSAFYDIWFNIAKVAVALLSVCYEIEGLGCIIPDNRGDSSVDPDLWSMS